MISDTLAFDFEFRSLLGTGLTGDLPTEASREPLASCDAAFSCLLQLAVQSGANVRLGGLHCRNVVDGDTVPISRLIELTCELGFQAKHARLDWQGLQTLGFSHPILVLLKNTNVIVLTDGGRDGASEVAVWDPLDRHGKIRFVRREDFERASTGHALIITPPTSNGAGAPPSLDFCWFTSAGAELLGKTSTRGQNLTLPAQSLEEVGTPPKPAPRRARQLTDRATVSKTRGNRLPNDVAIEQLPSAITDAAQQPSPARSHGAAVRRPFPLIRLWLAAAAIVVIAGIGVVLLRSLATDPIAAAIAAAREFSANALGTALPIGEVTVRKATSGRLEGAPKAEPEPARAPPPAAATEPTREPPTAAVEPAREPSPAAIATEPAREPPPAAAAIVASSAETTAQPPASVDPRLSAEEMAALLARGDTLLSIGDIASARLFYERAADAGGGLAAVRLGETFDPVFLDRIHLGGVRGDRGAALSWYRRARDLGATDAEALLKALEVK